jgi:hypothetical protein
MLGLLSRPVEFKEVFSDKKITLHVNPYFTISQFIETIRPILASQFNINENDIEIIESTQLTIPEMGLALKPSFIQLCNKWGNTLSNLCFYVRKKNYSYPQLQIQMFEDICPICLETTYLSRRYKCSHGICIPCYQQCTNTLTNNSCSICRSF